MERDTEIVVCVCEGMQCVVYVCCGPTSSHSGGRTHARFTLTVPDPDALSELVLLSGKDLSGDRLNL